MAPPCFYRSPEWTNQRLVIFFPQTPSFSQQWCQGAFDCFGWNHLSLLIHCCLFQLWNASPAGGSENPGTVVESAHLWVVHWRLKVIHNQEMCESESREHLHCNYLMFKILLLRLQASNAWQTCWSSPDMSVIFLCVCVWVRDTHSEHWAALAAPHQALQKCHFADVSSHPVWLPALQQSASHVT